jgi:hypothetical protein
LHFDKPGHYDLILDGVERDLVNITSQIIRPPAFRFHRLPLKPVTANASLLNVTGGWPDAENSAVNVSAIAKMSSLPFNATQFNEEVGYALQVNETLSAGIDCNELPFLIMRANDGMLFNATSTVQGIAGNMPACVAAVEKAGNTTLAALRNYVKTFGVLNVHPTPEGTLLSNDLANATLIDWADAQQVVDKVCISSRPVRPEPNNLTSRTLTTNWTRSSMSLRISRRIGTLHHCAHRHWYCVALDIWRWSRVAGYA